MRKEKRPGPGRPRREGLDEAILDAALAEMARVGYTRMTVSAVAAAAGTTKPTVYSRFASKELLATSAIARMRRRTPRPKLSGDVRADLVAELRLFRAGALRPFGMSMLGSVLAEEHETPELLRLFREQVIEPRRASLRRILEAACADGRIAATADVELGISMLVGSLYALYSAGSRVPRDWPERVVDAWLTANDDV
jgi:AcrR family transcriptional regulator